MKLNQLNERGLTLLEVIVSITLLSIILLTFANLFFFSNKASISNNDKLVATHLAKSWIEILKENPRLFLMDNEESYITNSNGNCILLEDTYAKTKINDKIYNICIVTSQSNDEDYSLEDLNLINVFVEVTLPDSDTPISSKVEGYVRYE